MKNLPEIGQKYPVVVIHQRSHEKKRENGQHVPIPHTSFDERRILLTMRGLQVSCSTGNRSYVAIPTIITCTFFSGDKYHSRFLIKFLDLLVIFLQFWLNYKNLKIQCIVGIEIVVTEGIRKVWERMSSVSRWAQIEFEKRVMHVYQCLVISCICDTVFRQLKCTIVGIF